MCKLSTFGERFRKLREQKGWSQSEVGRRLGGVSRSTIAGYETKGRIPRDDMLIKIAELFDTTTDYLLGKTDSPEKPPVDQKRIEELDKKQIPHFDGVELTDEQKEALIPILESFLEMLKRDRGIK